MAVSLTWGVESMDCFAKLGQYQNVVFKVNWTLVAFNPDNGSTAYTQGQQDVAVDPTAPFTPYADLTEDQVLGWTKTALGTALVNQYEATVTNQVDPEVVSPPLPWAPPAEAE